MMKIEVFSDFACPFCYIGKKRLEQAITALNMQDEVEIEFKAYQLNPEADQVNATPLLEMFSDKQKETIAAIEAHAKEVGLQFDFDKVVVGNTEKAHRLSKWTKTFGKEAQFVELMMDAYFTKGFNMNENKELLAIVKKLELPVEKAREVLESNQFAEDLALDRYDIQQIPVTSVPFFVFENRYGIRGAEPIDIFKQTLRQTADALNRTLEIKGNGKDVCNIEGCED